jgi:hypothetical protein
MAQPQQTKVYAPRKLGRVTVKLKDGTSVTHEDVAIVTCNGGHGPSLDMERLAIPSLRITFAAPPPKVYGPGEWTEIIVEKE